MKKLFLLLTLLISINQVYASNNDSVMVAPGTYMKPGTVYSTATANGAPLSSSSATENKTDLCPAGFYGPTGGATYISQTRQVITYKSNGAVTGYSYSDWTYTDNVCKTTQTQVLACAAGYTGTITQQRDVVTAQGDYLYKDWVTTANNCVEDSSINMTVGYFVNSFLWTERFWGYSESNQNGQYGVTVYNQGSFATTPYIQGIRISDLFWNGSGDYSIWPNSLYVFGISGGTKYVFSCSDVAVNGVPATSPSSNGWTTNYGNFNPLFGAVSSGGMNIRIKINSCSIISSFAA